MSFQNIIGQTTVIEQLTGLFHQNRLSHALLFLGREGSGALPLARAFAQFIVCEKNNPAHVSAAPSLFGDAEPIEPIKATDACGQCAACVKSSKDAHPDIHYSFPVISIKKDRPTVSNDLIAPWREFIQKRPYGNVYDWLQHIQAENKQGNITALECEYISRKLQLKSYESVYKILIMWMPEYLGNEGNKLLKLIEEPPPHTLFLFVAESESKIIPTILSRLQLIRVPVPDSQSIISYLEKQQEIGGALAQRIAGMCQGNIREALLLSDQPDDPWEQSVRQWLNAILKTGPAAQVAWVDEIAKAGREKQKQFLRYVSHILELAVRIHAGINRENNASGLQTQADLAARIAGICSLPQLEAIAQETESAIYHIERNGNPKLLFLALSIRLYHIIANNSVILTS